MGNHGAPPFTLFQCKLRQQAYTLRNSGLPSRDRRRTRWELGRLSFGGVVFHLPQLAFQEGLDGPAVAEEEGQADAGALS